MRNLSLLIVLFICAVVPVLGQEPPGPPVGFVSVEFGFRAAYPAKPKYRVEKGGVHYFSVTVGVQMFSVSLQELTGEWQKRFETKLAETYDLNRWAYLKGAEGKLLGAKEVKIGDLPAREFTHTVGKDWHGTTRMVYSGGKLIFITAVTLVDLNPYRQQIADRFVQSFQFVPRKPTKQQNIS